MGGEDEPKPLVHLSVLSQLFQRKRPPSDSTSSVFYCISIRHLILGQHQHTPETTMRLAAHSHSLWSPLLTLPGRTALPGPSRRTVHLSSTVARPSGSLPAPHLPASPSSASSSSTTPSPPPPPASAPASAPAPSSGPRRPRNPTYPQPAPPARGEVPPYLRHPVGVPLAPSELAEKPTRPPRVEKEKAKTIKAPPLPRPLGSVVPPEASSKTWDGELRGEERHLADRGNM